MRSLDDVYAEADAAASLRLELATLRTRLATAEREREEMRRALTASAPFQRDRDRDGELLEWLGGIMHNPSLGLEWFRLASLTRARLIGVINREHAIDSALRPATPAQGANP